MVAYLVGYRQKEPQQSFDRIGGEYPPEVCETLERTPISIFYIESNQYIYFHCIFLEW